MRLVEELVVGSNRVDLRVAFLVGAMLLLSQHMVVEGIVISVNWQQNALLLQSIEGFTLVAVDPAAEIDDLTGAIRTLSDLQAGDVVECQGEPFGALLIAHKLHVISIADEAKTNQ